MSREENVKQVIVVRKDLKMRKGKIAAQAAHASMKVLLDLMYHDIEEIDGEDLITMTLELRPGGSIHRWLTDPSRNPDVDGAGFAKICLYVESEEHLLDLFQQAKDAEIPCALITDSGRTEFNGVATNTCIAIGPHYSDEIDKITGNLKLL